MIESTDWPVGTLMNRLPRQARTKLIALLSRPKRFESGETLLRQGEDGKFVYLLRAVQEGRHACVKVVARLDNGGETLLGIRLDGDLVGEMSVLRDVPRNATVTACADTFAYLITRDRFLAYLEENPKAWSPLYEMLADRLEWSNQRRQEFGSFPVAVRLARVLLNLVDRHGTPHPIGRELGVQLSQAELGLLIGAGEDAVSQAMRQLREAGLVAPKYRSAVVTDHAALAAFASAA
jgi:CRP-like cAMP-binding protein